jgi:hypothetical protein
MHIPNFENSKPIKQLGIRKRMEEIDNLVEIFYFKLMWKQEP